MNDRRFTEEEFAQILHAASEIQARRGTPGTALAQGTGTSLEEIQAIAREVGIDPDVVAEAASRLVAARAGKEGLLTTHYLLSDTVPGKLSDDGRVAVLQAIRETSAIHGDGDVSGVGVEWSSPKSDTTQFRVSVYDVQGNQEVRVSVDRRGTAILTHFPTTMLGFVGGMAVAEAVAPGSAWLGAGIVLGGMGGGLALGRTIWRVTERKTRERAERILSSVGAVLRRLPKGDPS
ncbi:MAG: hypothetical protein P8188_19735 [Gemmatimonadota bacterium]